MRWWPLVLCACVAALVNADPHDDEWRLVKTSQGQVRGRKYANNDLYIFYDIPYATVPKNDQRFRGPLPAPVWFQPYIAEDKSIICPQFKMDFEAIMPKHLVMQEDCLVATVYVPTTDQKNLSVLVYVHGGGFQIGYGNMMKPTEMAKFKDMIIVTFNYRLGTQGFLCLGSEDIPGNAGMKDQVALLRWVKKNIASFGGNPDDVTIAGGSAGSASVDLLMLSKSAQGLFHKVIPESGANMAAFSVQTDPVNTAKNYAKKLNYTNVDDFYALEHFYKTTPLEILNSISFMDLIDSTFGFSPCVEREMSEKPFLIESPFNILKKGNYKKVPLLYGFANMEGLIRIELFEFWKDRMNERFSDFLPPNLQFENEDEKEEISNRIKEFYFGDKSVGQDTVLKYIDYFTDIIFAYPTLWATKLHVEAGHDQVYLYEFSYVDETTPAIPHTNVRGASHCAQTMTVFDGNFTQTDETILTEEYRNMKKVTRELWHNFIITGKPVPEGSTLPAWPPVGADLAPYMALNLPIELRGALLPERMAFWDQIYEKYYREPTAPPTPPAKHTEF